ncbi:ATP-binding protein [Phocaeicola plebeius]|uniref:ATP-binding protein n=1 Tax=Phocaeicola plebeius TaxID=310297 RepID=UPI0026EDA854|nr:ATP-binding protein [Phocaeicola plebeius]MCI6050071.1 winged helix-turn-helix transcriptional regulator [Phocaeicola plebeius]MDD6912376.1 ATP-binding protein [Phocaeicola plebeius]MDY5979677.1 ATP-binding protein [Phocaeicola plebeius]
MEIVNGGVLPDGWTVETLLSSHRSFPYNPDIANAFFRSGEIEAWGRGIERIITACKNDGFSTPEFRCDASGIWTIFKYEYPERATTQKTAQKTAQKIGLNLTEQQRAILSFLKEYPGATRKEISENLLNITEDGVKYNLSRLQELGLLKRVGGRKQGYWQILE